MTSLLKKAAKLILISVWVGVLTVGCKDKGLRWNSEIAPTLTVEAGPFVVNGDVLQSDIKVTSLTRQGKPVEGWLPPLQLEQWSFSDSLWERLSRKIFQTRLFSSPQKLEVNLVCNATNQQGTTTCQLTIPIPTGEPIEVVLKIGDAAVTLESPLVAYPIPSLTAISISSVGFDAPQTLSLTGTHFRTGMLIQIDTKECSQVLVHSSTQAECQTPLHDIGGPYDIVIKMPDKQVAHLASALSYQDKTAPLVSLTLVPPARSNQTSFNFEFSAVDNFNALADLSVQCRFNGAAFTNCSSPYSVSGFTEDTTQTFTVKVTDQAGNIQERSHSWVFDSQAPTLSIVDQSSLAPNLSNSLTARSVTVGGSDVVEYKYKVINSGLCTGVDYSGLTVFSVATNATVTFTPSTEQSYTLCLIGKDSAGNWQTAANATSTSTLVIDTHVEPFSSLLVTPESPSSSVSPVISGTAEAGASVALYKNSVDCTGTTLATGTAHISTGAFSLNATLTMDGDYNFSVKATDGAGNSLCSSAIAYRLDRQAPTVTLTSFNSAGLFKGGDSSSITWNVTATDLIATPITLEYSTNGGGSWIQIAANLSHSGSYLWTLPSVNSSNMKVRVKAKDLAGNVGEATSSAAFAIDSSNPLVTLSSFNSGALYKGGTSTALTWSASDNNLLSTPIHLHYTLDDGSTWMEITSNLSNSGTYSWTLPTNVNSNNVRVRVTAVDQVGHSTSAQSTIPFTIDSSAPSVNLTSLTGGQIIAGAGNIYQITWTAADANFGSTPIKIEYSSTAGSTWASLTNSSTNSGSYNWTVNVPDGTQYRVKVTATDAVGNITIATSSTNFVVTSQVPTLTQTLLNSPHLSNGSTVTFGGACDLSASMSNTDVAVGGTDTPTSVPCTGSAPLGTWSYTTATQSSDGNRTYTFTQTNGVGASNSLSAVWIRDTTPPIVSAVQVNNGDAYLVTTMASIAVTASDVATGQVGLKVRIAAVEGSATSCQAAYANDKWSDHINPTMTYTLMVSDNDVGDNAVKKLCAWAKDSVGNVTVISPASGTLGQNMDTITYANTQPPQITSFTVSNAADGSINYLPGDLVKITWTMTDSVGLHNNPVTLEYTNNNETTWNVIESAYGNLSGNPTSYSHTYLGFNAPVGVFKIRIRSKNLANLTSPAIVSPTQASTPWSVFAGSRDRGIGGNAKSTLLFKHDGTRANSFAFDPVSGDLYAVDDTKSGIVKVDARTGIVSTFIAYGIPNLPSDGTMPANPKGGNGGLNLLAFDSKRNLYVMFGNVSRTLESARLYQINLNTNKVRLYLGNTNALGYDASTSTPTTVFLETAGIAFDESNSLYFFTSCKAGTTYNGGTIATRLMKVTQNEDGTPGTLSNIAGDCTKGTPVSGANALSTPLSDSWDGLYYAVSVWNNGSVIYYTVSDKPTVKILDGVSYSTTLPSGAVGITYSSQLNKLIVATNSSSLNKILEYQPSLSGAGGETLSATLVNNTGTSNCNVEGVNASAACFVLYGSLGFNSEGKLFFGIGQTGSPRRIGYVDSQSKVRVYAGSLPFSGIGADKSLARGFFGGIYYKQPSEPNQALFPAGLYFSEYSGMVMGRIESDGVVTALAGDQSGTIASITGKSFTPSVSLGISGSFGIRKWTFDASGLPWFIPTLSGPKLHSVNASNLIELHQPGGDTWDYASLSNYASSIFPSSYGGYQNLTAKGRKFFFLGRTYMPENALTQTNPVLRILDYTTSTSPVVQIMGTDVSGAATDSPEGVVGDVGSKSIDGACYNTACALQFVENDPSITSDDQLYMAENEKLRVITDPTTPANSSIKTLFTTSGMIQNFTISIDPVTLKPDGKRIFYTRSNKLYCHATLLAYENSICKYTSHIDLGPPSGMNTISKGPNQFTWKTATTLLISGYNGEIYRYDLPE